LFARPELNAFLPKLYKDECELVVVFLCENYFNKTWCKLEWRQIQSLIEDLKEARRVMYVLYGEEKTIDFSKLPGYDPLSDGGYPINREGPKRVADAILSRLGELNDELLKERHTILDSLPLPERHSPSGLAVWLAQQLRELAEAYPDFEDAVIDRCFRMAFQLTQLSQKGPLSNVFSGLALHPKITLRVLQDYFRFHEHCSSFSADQCFSLVGKFKSLLDIAPLPAADEEPILSVLIQRMPEADDSYACSAVLQDFNIDGQKEWRIIRPSVPSVGISVRQSNVSSLSECIQAFRDQAKHLYPAASLLIDLYVPRELLDADWELQIRVRDEMGDLSPLSNYRLRSYERWVTLDYQEARSCLAEKYAYLHAARDCRAFFVSSGTLGNHFSSKIVASTSDNARIAVIHYGSLDASAHARMEWYKSSIRSFAPLVMWCRHDRLLSKFQLKEMARLLTGNEEMAFQLRDHNDLSAEDHLDWPLLTDPLPSVHALQRCHSKDSLVALFDEPLTYSIGRPEKPILFLAAEGDDLKAPECHRA